VSAAVPGVRPPVLSAGSGTLLDELRRFRHVIHLHYGNSLDSGKVEHRARTMRELLPLFRGDLANFEAAMVQRDGA
jgi:hypothetical protein